MRNTTAILLFSAFMVTGCTLEQQNGDLRVIPGPLISGQPWHITRQAGNTCTISSWELDVTQQRRGNDIQQQVEINNPLSPGNSYKILIGSHNYETMDNYFGPGQSREIIQDFMTAPVIYTERTEYTLDGNAKPVVKHWPNNIKMNGFAEQYRKCTQFLRP